MDIASLIQQSQRQQPQLFINLAMKQALHVLCLPLLELSEWLRQEVESNPALEMTPPPSRLEIPFHHRGKQTSQRAKQDYQESLLTAPISLYEHLTKQLPLLFETREEIQIAEQIIGHLNSKGYLDLPLQEVLPNVPLEQLETILSRVQTLDPPGIGARDVRDCLLLQLELKGKGEGIAAQILSEHFEDLTRNQIPSIAKKLHLSLTEVKEIIEKEIAPLDLYPGYRYASQPQMAIIPDLLFFSREEKWHVEVNTAFLPRFQVAPSYAEALRSETLCSEEYQQIRKQLTSHKWLKRTLQRRNQTLQKLGEFILKRQIDFFEGHRSSLVPVTMQEAARELGLHESTIARAVSGKYVSCPEGLFLLKHFFTQGISCEKGGTISKHSLRAILARTIAKEDKGSPLSDAQLSQHFKKLGFSCARRTIAKYRSRLRIAPASRRRRWS